MPWKERRAVDERKEFVKEWEKQEAPITDLCRFYGVSRKTAYKWIDRYEKLGDAGLEELSRTPRHSPQQMSAQVRDQILELREAHCRWGPRKLREYLKRQQPNQSWPAASSISDLLRREGLSHPRSTRRRTPPYSDPLAHAQSANQVWCADYKGWFRCGDGTRCDPLTITDAHSRFLFRCRSVEKTDELRARGVFEATFNEYGLPDKIRTDNGPPFATPAPAGLSRLSIWWLHLGIGHERIEPGHPEQNGRHERMHQTLKQETASPPQPNLTKQQEAFHRFEYEYNYQRPHQALGYQTPADLYTRSRRRYPCQLPELEYSAGMALRVISSAGEFKWQHQDTFVSKVLSGEVVGLLEVEDQLHELYLGPVLLGLYDSREHYFEAARPGRWHASNSDSGTPNSTGGKP